MNVDEVVCDVLELLANDSDDELVLVPSTTSDDEDDFEIIVPPLDVVDFEPISVPFDNPPVNIQFGGASPARPVIPLEVNLEINGNNIRIEDHWTTFNERFGVDGVVYRFVPDLQEDVEDVVDSFRTVINEIFDYLRTNFDQRDYVEFFINGDGFNSGGFSLPLSKIMDLDERSLLNQFSDIVQSNEDIEIDDGSFTIEVYHVTLPRGAGYRDRYLLKSYGQNLENILKSTKSLVNIPRRVSPYCASAALLVGKEILVGETNSWRSSKFTNRMVNRLIFQSKAICRQAGLSVGECGVNLEGVKKLAQLSQFCDHPIHVISRECHNSVVLSCNKDGIERPIYLYLADNHFFPVRSVNSLLGGDGRFCTVCDRFVTGRTNRHICDAKVCCQCKTVCNSPKFSSGFMQCDACLRYFHSETCFQNHLIVGKSSMFSSKFCVCDKIKACKECGVDLLMHNGKVKREAYSKRKHECFKSRCFCCGKYVDLQTHLCYLRKLDPLEPKFKQRIDKKRGQYCFFDMETMKVYDEELKRTVFKPNLIVFQFEDGTEEIFAGEQCLKEFAEFLFVGPHSLVKQDEYFTIIGHNAARFDSFFFDSIIFGECG